MRTFKFLSILLISVSFFACTQNITKQSHYTNDSWETFENNEFSIQYPDTFDLDTSGYLGMEFMLKSRLTTEQDIFSENVNLVIEDISEYNFDLDTYVVAAEERVKEIIPNYNLIESQKVESRNGKFYKFTYTGSPETFELKWLQYCFLKNGKAYIVTLTCMADQYEEYLPVAQNIMDSFLIK